jgi:UDP-N-acetylmuramoyl-tripeptide--D-alanyl-D-alanine ligase
MRIDGVAIVNMDDDAVRDLAGRWSGRSITFGKDAFVFAEDIAEKRGKGTDFTLGVGEIKRRVRMTTLGDCNIQNALAAAASCWSLGIGCDIICEGLETFRQPPGRMNVSRLKNGAYLIDDTYNANPESTGKALEMLAELKGDCKSAVIFGDMLELGDTEEEIHEKIGKLMSSTRVGRIFLRGDLVRAVAAGAEKSGMKKDHIFLRETPEEVAGYLEGWLGEGDCVIVKGSRRMKMEEFVFAIKEKSGEVDD